MARRPPTPQYRRSMVKAVILFGLLAFVGIGWALHAGRASPSNPYAARHVTTATYAGQDLLSQEDYNTLHRNERGAIAGYATVVGSDRISVDGRAFRLWGVQAFSGRRSCAPGSDASCNQTALSSLQSWADGVLITCHPRGMGITGVETAQCYRGHHDLASLMVQAGMANTLTTETRMYELSRSAAKSSGRGYWGSGYWGR